jgi:hypothetical protein
MTPALPLSLAALFATRSPAAAVVAEAEFQEKFLGDDLETRCAVAIATGDPVFLASAALPVENRRAAVAHWRKKRFAELLKDSGFARFFAAADTALRESIEAGETPLVDTLNLFAAFQEEAAQRRNASLCASKAALRSAVHAVLKDGRENAPGGDMPGFLAILETGEFAIFRHRAACQEWARAAECRYMLCVFDSADHRIFPGPEVD